MTIQLNAFSAGSGLIQARTNKWCTKKTVFFVLRTRSINILDERYMGAFVC